MNDWVKFVIMVLAILAVAYFIKEIDNTVLNSLLQ